MEERMENGSYEPMKQFIGSKLIKAKPMNREEYNNLRNWEVPKDENPQDEGYFIEDQNQKSNLIPFKGYISWSPKENFEKTYLELKLNPLLQTTAPSISQEMVNDFIVDYDVFTKQDKITIVIATLKNGFTIVESSACVSPENYDENIGETICKERIENQVWNHLGFLLQSSINNIK